MLCPLKFSHYEFEGGQDCVGSECGMHKLCGANDTLAAENDVSEASVDANDGNADTREKLEDDVREFWFPYNGMPSVYSKENVDRVLGWLDRQAAITDSECRSEFDALDEHAQALERENAELKAKLGQMTAERDILQDCVDDLNADTSELQRQMDAMRDVVRDFRGERDELTSELTAARNAHAQAEHEAVILREKLGRMLDCSHEITRIGGDC